MADTLSGQHLLDSYGGDMWDDLKKWLATQRENPPYKDDYYTGALFEFAEKMKEIEKEYGIE